MKQRMTHLRHGIFENGSYKLVALFISLILWLTILGRREFVVGKEIEVDFTVAENFTVAGQSSDRIRLKISGPQPLLKKYKESSQSLVLSLVDKPAGLHEIEMNAAKLDIPAGIRVLSVKPSQIRVEITSPNN